MVHLIYSELEKKFEKNKMQKSITSFLIPTSNDTNIVKVNTEPVYMFRKNKKPGSLVQKSTQPNSTLLNSQKSTSNKKLKIDKDYIFKSKTKNIKRKFFEIDDDEENAVDIQSEEEENFEEDNGSDLEDFLIDDDHEDFETMEEVRKLIHSR